MSKSQIDGQFEWNCHLKLLWMRCTNLACFVLFFEQFKYMHNCICNVSYATTKVITFVWMLYMESTPLQMKSEKIIWDRFLEWVNKNEMDLNGLDPTRPTTISWDCSIYSSILSVNQLRKCLCFNMMMGCLYTSLSSPSHLPKHVSVAKTWLRASTCLPPTVGDSFVGLILDSRLTE